MPGRRTLLYLPLLILIGAGAACAHTQGSSTVMADTTRSASPHPSIRVQLIITFEDGTAPESMRRVCDTTGATYVRSLGWAPAIVVLLPEGMTAEEGMARFKAQPGVVGVEVDRQVRAEPVRGPSVGK